jgi:5'-deoxynucleotidase YfbR-like HD superfamily hydrolase
VELNDTAKYLYEMGYLKQLKRAGWGMVGIAQPESVAEHSFRTAILGYILASLEGADPMKTAVMCLFHDTAEARIGDLHRVAKRYLKVKDGEQMALAEQTQRLPKDMAHDVVSLLHEYEERDSLEGQLAHDADTLECLIQAREYQRQGHTGIEEEEWITNTYASLKSNAARDLANACLQVEPHEWWKGLKIIK